MAFCTSAAFILGCMPILYILPTSALRADPVRVDPQIDSDVAFPNPKSDRDFFQGMGATTNWAVPFDGVVNFLYFDQDHMELLMQMFSRRHARHGFKAYAPRVYDHVWSSQWDHVCQFEHDPEDMVEGSAAIPLLCSDTENGSVILAGDFGFCDKIDRPCRYVVVLRDPIERLVDHYNRYCFNCGEEGHECPDPEHLLMCPEMSIVEYAEYFGNVYTKRFIGCNTHECLLDRHDKALEVLKSDDVLVLLYEHLKSDKKIWHSKDLSLKHERLRAERAQDSAPLTYTKTSFGNSLEVLSWFLGESDDSSLLPSSEELTGTWVDGPRYGVGLDLMENCFTDVNFARKKHTWKCDETSYESAKALCEWIGDECKFFVQYRSSDTSEDVETCGSHMTHGECYFMCYQPIRTTHGGNEKSCSFVRSGDWSAWSGGDADGLYNGTAASPQVAADGGTPAPAPTEAARRADEGADASPQATAMAPAPASRVQADGTTEARRPQMEKRTRRATSGPYSITDDEREQMQEILKYDIDLVRSISEILVVKGADTTCPGGCSD